MNASVLGIDLFLDEVVLRREPPRYKVWETVGTPRLVVIGGYRLGFEIAPVAQGVLLRVFISYNLSSSIGERMLSRVFWTSLREMVRDADARWRDQSIPCEPRRAT